MIPLPDEVEIRGFWIDVGSSVVPDSNWERITWLVTKYLESTDSAAIFRDPADGRQWELLHPMPHLKNGGPPLLRCRIGTA